MKYLKYSVYDWLGSIGIKLKWEVDEKIDQILI